MARLISIVTIIGIALVSVLTAQDFYDDKYDDIDIDEILINDKLRDEYYACFMDFQPCSTADMKFFKEIIGEAVITKCQKCTEKQKQKLDKVIDWYVQNKNDEWNAFVAKSLEDLKKKNGQ